MTLPHDYARCIGYQTGGEWREGCADCLRRTSPGREHRQAFIQPPIIIVFECDKKIAPEDFK